MRVVNGVVESSVSGVLNRVININRVAMGSLVIRVVNRAVDGGVNGVLNGIAIERSAIRVVNRAVNV